MTDGILRLLYHIQQAGLPVAGWATNHNKTPVRLVSLAKLTNLGDFVDPDETGHEGEVMEPARMCVGQELLVG